MKWPCLLLPVTVRTDCALGSGGARSPTFGDGRVYRSGLAIVGCLRWGAYIGPRGANELGVNEACMLGARRLLEAHTPSPVGRQLWRDLLFVHQPVPADLLRASLPP